MLPPEGIPGGSMIIRNHRGAGALAGVALACALATGATAETTRSFSIHAFGSYHTYAMHDVNETMRAALAAFPGSTSDKDRIGSGGGYGGGIRVWPRSRVFVSLEFQRLLASNSGSGP